MSCNGKCLQIDLFRGTAVHYLSTIYPLFRMVSHYTTVLFSLLTIKKWALIGHWLN